MYKKFWQVLDPNGELINIIFITKRDAMAWIAEQTDGLVAEYTVRKVGM